MGCCGHSEQPRLGVVERSHVQVAVFEVRGQMLMGNTLRDMGEMEEIQAQRGIQPFCPPTSPF